MTSIPETNLAMAFVAPMATLSAITGQPTPASVLTNLVEQLGWKQLFVRLAQYSAAIANRQGGVFNQEILTHTAEALADYHHDDDPLLQRVGQFFQANPSTPVVTEQGIYVLQGVALLHGGETDVMPDDRGLALLLLLANDFIDRWQEPDPAGMSALDRGVADFVLATRYTNRGDRLTMFARPVLMMNPAHARDRIEDETWERLQRAAFGGATLREYVLAFGLPLYIQSRRWSADTGELKISIDPSTWTGSTALGAAWGEARLAALTAKPQSARSTLVKNAIDGVPFPTVLLSQRPFVEVEQDALVAASPMLVWDHLKYGIWGRLIGAFKKEYGNDLGATKWFGMFGDMFEQWCRDVARQSKIDDHNGLRLILSDKIGGDDEVEDVVIADQARAALFSVKSRLLPANVVRSAKNRSSALEWLRSFFFDPDDPKGALRLLNAKVEKLRNGDYETLAADLHVFPVVVTFEDLGENALLYRWLQAEIATRGLLDQAGVAPITILSVDDYEQLLAAAADGVNPLDILERRTRSTDESIARTSVLIHDQTAGKGVKYPAWVTELFDGLAAEGVRALFPKTEGDATPSPE